MVIEQRKTNVFLPKAAKKIQEIQDGILQIFHENDVKERIIFPMTSSIDLYEKYYDDIKKEYLLDFYNSEGDVNVYHPEYKTLIKDYTKEHFSDVKDYGFYYLQNCISYTSAERVFVKEDTVIGVALINSTSEMESWSKLTRLFNDVLKEIAGLGNYHTYFKNNGTVELNVHNIMVGHIKNEYRNGKLMEGHISITDLYEALNK